jgi:hypothetical protein
MNILELFSVLFLASTSAVHAIGLLPSLQGTEWYAGEKVYIQAVQTKDNDGSFYNAFLKSGDLVEQVLFDATYQQYNSFIVPSAFDNAGDATLYVLSEGDTNKDSMRVEILNRYDFNRQYSRRFIRRRIGGGCGGGGCYF